MAVAVAATEPRGWARSCAALALGATVAVAAESRASDGVDAAFLYYADSDHVTVASPHLSGSLTVGRIGATVATTVDVISAASTDIVTAASSDGFEEIRAEGSAAVSYELREGRSLSAHAGTSHAPDYTSYSAGAGAQWDVFGRAAAVSLGYTFAHGEAGRVDDTSFSRTKAQHQIDLGLSPILSPRLVADFSYGLTVVDGYQANPYRFVRLYARGAASHATAVREWVPLERVRHAAAARLRFRLARPVYGLVEHQGYFDTWGMWATALRARATLALGPWTLGLDGRLYRQTGAAFYRRRYAVDAPVPVFRTADKELGPMWTARFGPRVDWTTRLPHVEALRVGVGGDVYHMRYLDFAYLDQRTAWLASVDAALEF